MLPGTARAWTVFGVTEDAGKYSTDGGAAFFSRLHDLGMKENAVSVQWDPDRPRAILERGLLDRIVPNASRFGVRLVFSVYFTRPTAVSSRPSAPAEFAEFLRTLARAYPQVKDFVVGNEPNYGFFWQPQFGVDGTPVAGAAYEDVLARSYDALKSVDPRINVIGLGLAARGNDRPASSVPSTSPVLFLRDVGAAYRRSGRTRPLMDSLAYHPYPASSRDAPATRQGWPSAGVADLGRLKQAVWDAFHDTSQSTFETGLALKITEIGWQAAIPANGIGAYRGAENVGTTDEVTQAGIYAQLVRDLACDPAVTDVLFFHLIDEPDLRGFQSGLIRADGSHRPAYSAVQRAIAETGGRCTGTIGEWRHTEDVVGVTVGFGGQGFSVAAQEGASYRAAIVPVDGTPTAAERAALERSLEQADAPEAAGAVRAYARIAPRLKPPDEPGVYVQAVLVSAATDPSRTSFFLSEPFTVEPGASGAPAPAPGEAVDAAGDGPSAGEYAVAPTAIGTTAGTVRFRSAKAKARRVRPTRADFRIPPRGSTRLPGMSDLSTSEETKQSPAAADSTVGASLDPRKPKSMVPYLFALLLVGSALSAVIAIRLLGR
jgi:hypothetical protein